MLMNGFNGLKMMPVHLLGLVLTFHGVHSLSFTHTFEGSEYAVSDSPVMWQEGNQMCVDHGGTLAIVTTPAETMFFVSNLVGPETEGQGAWRISDRWIGLYREGPSCSCQGDNVTPESCQACRESWSWIDDTAMAWMNWFAEEPQTNRCGRITVLGPWAETGCNQNVFYVCERSLCWSDPCENGGTCEALNTTWRCQCPEGYTGDRCQTDIDDCEPQPCQHGGTCTDHVNSYSCRCLDGYTGVDCENDINECEERTPCNDGTCRNLNGSYECECGEYWTGRHCETDIDECAAAVVEETCQNAGNCTNLPGSFVCYCDVGFTGINCQSALPKEDSKESEDDDNESVMTAIYVGLVLVVVTAIPIGVLLVEEFRHRNYKSSDT